MVAPTVCDGHVQRSLVRIPGSGCRGSTPGASVVDLSRVSHLAAMFPVSRTLSRALNSRQGSPRPAKEQASNPWATPEPPQGLQANTGATRDQGNPAMTTTTTGTTIAMEENATPTTAMGENATTRPTTATIAMEENATTTTTGIPVAVTTIATIMSTVGATTMQEPTTTTTVRGTTVQEETTTTTIPDPAITITPITTAATNPTTVTTKPATTTTAMNQMSSTGGERFGSLSVSGLSPNAQLGTEVLAARTRATGGTTSRTRATSRSPPSSIRTTPQRQAMNITPGDISQLSPQVLASSVSFGADSQGFHSRQAGTQSYNSSGRYGTSTQVAPTQAVTQSYNSSVRYKAGTQAGTQNYNSSGRYEAGTQARTQTYNSSLRYDAGPQAGTQNYNSRKTYHQVWASSIAASPQTSSGTQNVSGTQISKSRVTMKREREMEVEDEEVKILDIKPKPAKRTRLGKSSCVLPDDDDFLMNDGVKNTRGAKNDGAKIVKGRKNNGAKTVKGGKNDGAKNTKGSEQYPKIWGEQLAKNTNRKSSENSEQMKYVNAQSMKNSAFDQTKYQISPSMVNRGEMKYFSGASVKNGAQGVKNGAQNIKNSVPVRAPCCPNSLRLQHENHQLRMQNLSLRQQLSVVRQIFLPQNRDHLMSIVQNLEVRVH